MKKQLMTIALLALSMLTLQAAEKTISSPDGKIKVRMSDNGGKMTYQVTQGDRVFIEPSPLGLITNIIDLTQDLVMSACDIKPWNDDYRLKTWKQSHIIVEGTEAVCQIEKDLLEIVTDDGKDKGIWHKQ